MRIDEAIARGDEPTFSFEFFPPKSEEGERNLEAALEELSKEKVDAGAGFLMTQLFFENADYFSFVARCRDAGIEVPIIPGIWPITNYKQIARISSLIGSRLPDRLLGELEVRADQPEAVTDFGVAYATLQCADLLANGAPGIHLYTLNRSPATRAIMSALRVMAPWRGAVPV